MTGVVVRKKNGLRLVLSLDLIMKSVSVEVDELDLEPIANPAPAFVSLQNSSTASVLTPGGEFRN